MDDIPHYSAPTHLMQMMRYVEETDPPVVGQWTNPVSLPELARIRALLSKDNLMLIVQDIFLTETAQLADVVLPAATRARKLARSRMSIAPCIFLKSRGAARRCQTGLGYFPRLCPTSRIARQGRSALIWWSDPESAFEAWKACSRGRPCDYSGITYDKLRGGSGIQWPCNEDNPEGTERLYSDGVFFSAPDYCESYGRDLETGAPVSAAEYQAMNPDAQAILRAADYISPHELPSDKFPLQLITGRIIYHFHTRTKTGRAPELNDAAPDVWVELSAADAATAGIREGDLTEISTARQCAGKSSNHGYSLAGLVFAISLRLLGHHGPCTDGPVAPRMS